jgi:hypothetical protein
MSLTWHMIRTDLYRLRRPLVLWFAVLAATPIFGAAILWSDGGSERWFQQMADVGIKMALLEIIVGLTLVPLLVHSDPVIGNTAFWITRPIARARLWGAKLGGVALIFGLAPILVLLPWWLMCGYGPRELALATGETLLWQAAIVGLALPLAALTDAFSRYFLWLLVVVAASATACMFLLFAPQVYTQTIQDLVHVWTRAWLALVVFVVGGGVVAAWQFNFRQTAQSFTVYGIAGGLALAVFGFWPRELTPKALVGAVAKPGPIGAGIQVEFEQARLERVNQRNADLAVWVRFSRVPDEMHLSAAWDETKQPAEHIWSWESGLRLERHGWIQAGGAWMDAEYLALGLPNPPAETREFWSNANERRQKNGLPPLVQMQGRWATARVQVPRAFEMRTRLEAPVYRLRLALDLTLPKLVDEQPLKVGETLRVGRTIARIAHLDFDRAHGPDRYSTVMERAPMLLWDLGSSSLVPFFRSSQPEPRYLLVNRARGNAVGTAGSRWGRFATVRIDRRELSQSPPWEWRDGKRVAAEDWFDEGVTLAGLSYEWQERFVKETTVEQFQLAPTLVTGGAK